MRAPAPGSCTSVVVLLVLLTPFCAAPAAAAQEPASVWAAAVDAYLEGRDEQATAVLSLPLSAVRPQARAALDAWLARARASTGGPRAGDERRQALRRVQAATVLALEVLLRVSARTPVAEVFEVYEDVAIDARERLDRAEQVRLEVLDSPGREARAAESRRLARFRAAWQVAFLQYLLNVRRYQDFVGQTAQVRIDDADPRTRAEFHFLRGLHHEIASRVVHTAREGPGRTLRSEFTTPAGGRPDSRLRAITAAREEAASAYDRALAADADHHDARLRAGRVALELGRRAEAVTRLAPLVTQPCVTVTCGLATLFTGEAHEQAGALDEASSAYARASSVQDVRQSALVALMQLGIRRGQGGSGSSLASHFAGTSPLARTDRPDAWSAYLSGKRAAADTVLASVRDAILP